MEIKMYKFIIVGISEQGLSYTTYNQLLGETGLSLQQIKKSIKKFLDDGTIFSITECETENLELYQAILDCDFEKISKFTGE